MQKKASHRLVIIPIIACIFLLTCLFSYIILQGNMQDWISFMGGEASMALFGLYSLVAFVGIAAIVFFKKNIDILKVSNKSLSIIFLVTIIFGLVAFSFLNFTSTQENYDWMHDGLLYQRMGQSWLINQEFIIDGVPTHHAGPLYPIYLSLFYSVLPLHFGSQIAIEIIFLFSIITIFMTTKKLFSTTFALISTGLIITNPTFLFSTSRNYSEPMVLILYTLTIFFILQSLETKKSNRIILAGLCAALGFLTKSGLSYFFIITGGAGFLWRFYYMRWRVFKNKYYLLAIGVFLSLVLTWTIRNFNLFWDGTISGIFSAIQPSQYLNDAIIHSITKDSGSFLIQFWFFTTLSLVFLIPYFWILSPHIGKALSKIRNERISCLVLAFILPILIGLVMGSALYIYENEWMPDYWITFYPVSQVRYLISTLIRYIFISIIPLSWLAFEIERKNP